MPPLSPPAQDSIALLLDALVWVVTEPARARRLLDLTGLDPDQLRAQASEPSTLVAVGRFLGDHEPDLVACAGELGVKPAQLVAATAALAEQE